MSAVDTSLTRLKTILEIVAIPVAAFWAFTRFTVAEAPSLEPRSKARADLHWYARSTDGCMGQFRVAFQNIGKTSIDVTGGHISVWLVSPDTQDKAISYLDPGGMRKGEKTYERDVTTDLAGHFAPDEGKQVAFAFFVKRNPGRIILFQVELLAKTQDGKTESWPAYRFNSVCGEGQESQVAVGKTTSP